MEITIKSDRTWEEKTNKGTVLRKQQAALDLGRDFPLVFNLTVNGVAYKPGKYSLAPESFRVTPFGTLELDPYKIALRPQG